MAKSLRYRMRAVGAMLSAEEYGQLQEVRAGLGLTVRDILLIGMRRSRKIWTIERRKQGRNGP
jgi:hypothetical protein